MALKALEGRVAAVTGSSRGIGRALALRFAREGARVVVTGKSEASTERLPGSIHSVLEEIHALGGEALPVRMDIRREEDVEGMVDKTIQAFGHLDILVNNASALWWDRRAYLPNCCLIRPNPSTQANLNGLLIVAPTRRCRKRRMASPTIL